MTDARGGGNLGRVTSAVFWNFSGRIAILLVRFAESVLLVRLLGRDEYGIYGSLVNLEAIVVLVISLGLESAVARFVPQLRAAGDTSRIRSLLGKVLRVRALLLLPAAAVFLAGGPFISTAFYHGLLPQGFLAAVLALTVIVSFHSIFRTFLDSFFEIRFVGMVEGATQTGYLVLAATLVWQGYGLGGVFAALVLAQAIAAVLLWGRFRRTLGDLPDGRAAGDAEGAGGAVEGRRVIGYSWSLYLYGILLYVLGKGLDVLLLGVLLGDMTQVAWYMIAFNLAWYSLGLMDLAVSANFITALIVEASAAQNTGLLRKIFTGLFECVYVYALPVAAGGAILAPALVRTVYGEANAGAALLMTVFIAGMTAGKLSSVTSYFLVALDRERTLVRARLAFGAANLVLAIVLIPRWGAMGAVAATSLVMAGISAYEAVLVHRLMQPRYSAGFLMKTAVSTLVMAVPVAAGYLWWDAPLAVKTPALALGGCAIYLAGIRSLRPLSPEVSDLLTRTEYPFRGSVLRLLALR